MSDLPGNQNYEEAERFINEASERNNFPYAERAIIAQNGLTLATLALAYEQRTANLIAVMAMSPLDLTDWPQPAVDNFLTQNNNIMTRLGLNEGATK